MDGPNPSNATWIPHFKNDQITLTSIIGDGGEAVVWLAKHEHFGFVLSHILSEIREVALKRFTRKSALNGKSKEIDILLKIKHPHIVQIYGILIEEDGQVNSLGFIMEYMKLGSLHNMIHNPEKNLKMKYELREIFSWIIQVCRGLQYLHELNIIHRDVKPKNILMCSMDTLKLADFGIARELNTGSVTFGIGTPHYMAPELIIEDNNQKYAQPADVYSLAITIWEIFHRKTPYYEMEGNGFYIIATKVREGRRPAIDTSKVDLELTEFLQGIWHQDPSKRQSLAEIKEFSTRKLEETAENLKVTGPSISIGKTRNTKTTSSNGYWEVSIEENMAWLQESMTMLTEQTSTVINKVVNMEVSINDLLAHQNGEVEKQKAIMEKMKKEKEWFGENPQTILVMGPSTEFLILNKDRTEWKKLSIELPCHNEHGGSVVFNDEIYLFGGNILWNETYKLDSNMKWVELASMNQKRSWIVNSSLVFEDCIWVFGGYDGKRQLNTVERYSPEKNRWIQMTPMRQSRGCPAAAVINGKIIISGGQDGEGKNRLKSVECFDPPSGVWTALADMPGPRNGHAMISNGNNLIVLGGWDGKMDFANVWRLSVDEENATWIELQPMKVASRQFPAISMDKAIWAIGGYSVEPMGLSRVEVFDGESWKDGPELPGHGYFISSSFLIPVHLAVTLLRNNNKS